MKTTVLGATGTLLPAGGAVAKPGGGRGIQRYKRLGRTELEISDISFGASRLREGEEHLVHRALDLGINYFDSAESYTRGQSETVLGKALAGRRDQVHLVGKRIAPSAENADSMMRALEESLTRLNTDYIDVYMNHAVNDVERMRNAEWHAFIQRAKAQGKIRFAGMSGHAGNLIGCVDYALDEDLVDVLLVAYNFGQDPKFYEGMTRSFDMIEALARCREAVAAFGAGGAIYATKAFLCRAMARLAHKEAHGDSDHAFGWSYLRDATHWRAHQCAVAAE